MKTNDDRIVNSKMFYAIADVIETYPEKHEQEQWFEHFGHISVDGPVKDSIIYDGVRYECDTNQCVAGWAVVLDGKKISFSNQDLLVDGVDTTDNELIKMAADILGLEYSSAHTLFYTMDMDFDWPNMLRDIGDGLSVEDAIDEQCYR
jgi:hypothetical protein